MDNQLVLSGNLIGLGALRYTPAGIPVIDFRISHASQQIEAGHPRAVQCELAGLAFEREARLMAAARPGMQLTVSGFLAARSRDSKQLVLHATNIEFVEGV